MHEILYIIGGIILISKAMANKKNSNISKHITFSESIRSRTAIKYGIKNMPNSENLKNMRLVAKKVFEPLRNHFGVPIRVNSFFRTKELNDKLQFKSSTSQHIVGQAIDISIQDENINNADLFFYIKDNLIFDQLIWEFGSKNNPQWVHVSYKKSANRGQVLKAISYRGKKGYTKFK